MLAGQLVVIYYSQLIPPIFFEKIVHFEKYGSENVNLCEGAWWFSFSNLHRIWLA